jgi:hypothetical protein
VPTWAERQLRQGEQLGQGGSSDTKIKFLLYEVVVAVAVNAIIIFTFIFIHLSFANNF